MTQEAADYLLQKAEVYNSSDPPYDVIGPNMCTTLLYNIIQQQSRPTSSKRVQFREAIYYIFFILTIQYLLTAYQVHSINCTIFQFVAYYVNILVSCYLKCWMQECYIGSIRVLAWQMQQ